MSRMLYRALGLALASIALGLAIGTPAAAQIAPGASSAPQAVAAPADAPPAVVLAEYTRACATPNKPASCDTPRAARPSTIGPDSPVFTLQQYVERYPQMGVQGYMAAGRANQALCQRDVEYLSGLSSLDQLFISGDNTYQILQEVYNALPDKIRRATRIAYVGQGVSTAAGCVMSFGWYCLMVAANAGGNIMTLGASKDLQIANIRLSVANIMVTRANIWSNRLTLRLDAEWIIDYHPFCQKAGYAMNVNLAPLGPPPMATRDFSGP